MQKISTVFAVSKMSVLDSDQTVKSIVYVATQWSFLSPIVASLSFTFLHFLGYSYIFHDPAEGASFLGLD